MSIAGPRLLTRADFQEASEPTRRANPESWLVLAIVVVVLAVFFAWLYVSVSSDTKAPDVVQRCNPGLCAFDVFSGVKRCPVPGQVQGLRVAPGVENCTSANYCQAERYTCAVQPDQSWRCDGVCGPGNEQCRCIADPTSGS